ncbi:MULTISPECIES: Phr family secreted Rap phosphatase inhibitor [unclassified Bacillus cereus group]|nr:MULTISPECIES: Phr family secreted Rap phosphatase inhibitor [unclassified Bacillus cereus group]
MKKIKITLLGLMSVVVVSFGLNSPITKDNASSELKYETMLYVSEPGGGI